MRTRLSIAAMAILFLATFGLVYSAHADAMAPDPIVVIADTPFISYEGTTEPAYMDQEYWFRCNTKCAIFTFDAIDTAKIIRDSVILEFNVRITNHKNGDFGLDGLLDITLNEETDTIRDVLFDNEDPQNHVDAWETADDGGVYWTHARVKIGRDKIIGDDLIVKVHRHIDVCDFEPHAPDSTYCPIDTSTTPPTIPANCYDDDDGHTVHMGVGSQDEQRADIGEVRLYIDLRPVPALTNWGLIILLFLLLMAGLIVIRQRRRAVVR